MSALPSSASNEDRALLSRSPIWPISATAEILGSIQNWFAWSPHTSSTPQTQTPSKDTSAFAAPNPAQMSSLSDEKNRSGSLEDLVAAFIDVPGAPAVLGALACFHHSTIPCCVFTHRLPSSRGNPVLAADWSRGLLLLPELERCGYVSCSSNLSRLSSTSLASYRDAVISMTQSNQDELLQILTKKHPAELHTSFQYLCYWLALAFPEQPLYEPSASLHPIVGKEECENLSKHVLRLAHLFDTVFEAQGVPIDCSQSLLRLLTNFSFYLLAIGDNDSASTLVSLVIRLKDTISGATHGTRTVVALRAEDLARASALAKNFSKG